MSLTTSEIQRCKHELGFNQINVGAEPYIGVTMYFEQVVLPNLNAGALTLCSTPVAAAGTPQLVTLTLQSTTGFSLFARVVVDVDENQETAQVAQVSGATISVYLAQGHGAPGLSYPVTVEGGESLVREYLRRLRTVTAQIEKVPSRAGVKKVDEIELETSKTGLTQLETLLGLQKQWRRELCTLLFGVGEIAQFRGRSSGSGARISLG